MLAFLLDQIEKFVVLSLLDVFHYIILFLAQDGDKH